jgi:CheY-like chemotaxis protein/signal transduction histidine kinase
MRRKQESQQRKQQQQQQQQQQQKQQQQQQTKGEGTNESHHSISPSPHECKTPALLPENKDCTQQTNVIPPSDTDANEDDNDFDNDFDNDDNTSCCTLLDSAMSFHPDIYNRGSSSNNNNNNHNTGELSEDNTISTNHMGSSNTGSNNSTSNSNITPTNDTFQGSSVQGSLASTSSVRSNGSATRGEEHINSRMKKYGLYNLHEMKRKQQQQQQHRKVGRTLTNSSSHGSIQSSSIQSSSIQSSSIQSSSNNHNNNHNNNKGSSSVGYGTIASGSALSLASGFTENMTESNGPGGRPPPHSRDDRSKGSGGLGGGGGANRDGSRSSSNSNNSEVDVPTKIRTAPLHVQMAVEEIHRWLFTEGGHFTDVETLMTQYSLYVREHFGIPLDRLYYGGVGLHPKLTAYLWKWEAHGEFTHSEMPPHIFVRRNEIFSPDEPFCVLEQGRADYVRIRDTDDYIPPDTAKWFRGQNYKDYFALPDIHRGVSKGGLAWSTKSADGFCDDDIQFFRMTHAALTTIMRLHTNDLVLNTLTDRMEAEIEDRTNELAIANKKLEEANEEISKHASKQLEHFACMSHEIRTPLNCIVGLSSLLLESDDLNEDLLETIHMVYNSADLVQGVVNDVLDYAKIESGHFELDVKPSDLQTTLNGVVHSISNKLQVQAKNVEVRTSYSGKLGTTMTTDSRRLQQILYNILGNAAKFSREGTTIDFRVTMIQADDSNNREDESKTPRGDESVAAATAPKPTIRFSIMDYGKGIEEKNFEKIFQPFSQASKETQTIYGGTGLGLSITKNLVARLGGSIRIRSEIDEFTEFIVDLPYDGELADDSRHKERMSETSIVILDPNERPEDAPPLEEDEFVPFPFGVVEQYDLNVMRCSSWGELESKLGLRANIRENYVILAHEDIEERQGILNVEKLVRRERCSWFTFGSESSLHQRQHHFKTLTGIFPAALIDTISEVAIAQREMGNSGSTFGSSETDESDLGAETTTSLQQPPPPPSSSSLSSTESKKKRFASKYPPRALKVLVVDDNVINQKVLDRILRRLGVTDIAIVNNGKKAVDITETTKFDCIFMDMEMPVMGGLEACKLIVDRDKAARVAFVTAHDVEDIRQKADAVGAYRYISKPLKINDIHAFLHHLEELSPAGAGASNKVIATTAAAETSTTNHAPSKKQRRPSIPKKKKRATKQYPPRNIKVLVAEDNVINQKVLERILKRLGVRDITIVDNGKKAVNASEATRFDCILMDMQMPVMDGLEACKIIVKNNQDAKDGPKIVFVTAHALAEFKEKALAAGAFDFITKPFKMQDIDKVLNLLEVHQVKANKNAKAGPLTQLEIIRK